MRKWFQFRRDSILLKTAIWVLSSIADGTEHSITVTVHPRGTILSSLLKKAHVSTQPITNVLEMAVAVQELEVALPGWWWCCGSCGLTRHASCGPESDGPDAPLLDLDEFKNSFDCDDAEGSVASSLRDVLEQSLRARKAALKIQKGRET